ncbi:low molecular weight phosphatase family protein [Agrococcus beijingensis]|uniref:arsenate reductase/protein-tyrosine-phosphatase family protein n=1 Tax=Agrococcus beijingensis TaxID=3068634 RepID=UPI0027411299|nr:low molecular weight phosphatase family protein [Agrococcus sp. REN33]
MSGWRRARDDAATSTSLTRGSAGEATSADPVFRILTVCTGNLCRSPQAEQLLRARIPAALGIGIGIGAAPLSAAATAPAPDLLAVASAGTMAYDGDPMDDLAASEAERLGVGDVRAHRTRRIREPHVLGADLVLGMAREHRAAGMRLVPSASRRAFTLIEFAHIVEALAHGDLPEPVPSIEAAGPAAFLRAVVHAAARTKGRMRLSATSHELDIEDPYRLDPAVYRRSAEAIDGHVARIADGLATLARA